MTYAIIATNPIGAKAKLSSPPTVAPLVGSLVQFAAWIGGRSTAADCQASVDRAEGPQGEGTKSPIRRGRDRECS
jgi:hypothetical protein